MSGPGTMNGPRATGAPLVEFDDLKLEIETFDGTLRVLDGVTFSLGARETLGIVGETGCGKSVTARSLLRLLPMPPARFAGGAIRFEGEDLTKVRERRLRRIRGQRIALIPQDPMTYLNPVLSVGRQLTDVVAARQKARPPGQRLGRAGRRRRAAELLAQVQLPHPERQLEAYPHELSGGMRQRVLIAMALAGEPALLVADEPTTALDVTIQGQVLRLIHELVERLGLAVLLISHDLGVVAKVCRRIVVMYAGTIVEDAPTAALLARPLHPYTQGLLKAIPKLHGDSGRLPGIPGAIPNLLDPPSGCRFRPRCPLATEICAREKPPVVEAEPGHRVACHRYPGPPVEADFEVPR
ncbi:peptide/nickel transport system ATP-binding protein/oligopeptide transport system ATP-binding protein [Tistlia consotensis]|uniref:Peptide/nickel transport system ATP-binding protein/oligopeptide transport system ATP-binding protein n=1 Tax=Tistlia consotensis USBA 355 TaxID=560819 RepID=A0A1Y6CEV5_9PROT|nr:ABC transporter ATP-binding protein [Tistlia consotensis]SMF59476.1 peptide/nickel transport system ATP-binding protein/oligopeptide transport system ATP-binding protein [Tistlia consotensis USBA 355]SNR64377.1 peptide/nickel transport system ATP-binding protein/oligopeptide transport system ATP-binding protein [Tistlia consotensis]